MPAFVKRSVGSFPGTSGLDGTIVWPRARKNSRKARRISAALVAGFAAAAVDTPVAAVDIPAPGGPAAEGRASGVCAAFTAGKGLEVIRPNRGRNPWRNGYDPTKTPGTAKIALAWPSRPRPRAGPHRTSGRAPRGQGSANLAPLRARRRSARRAGPARTSPPRYALALAPSRHDMSHSSPRSAHRPAPAPR